MRIGTWNLERGSRRKSAGIDQLRVLDELHLDVAVLTEPSDAVLTREESTIVSSLGRGDRKPWVAIVGDDLEPRGEPRDLSVAAETRIAGQRVLVYGSVLPWTKATTDIPEIADGRSSEDFFMEELDAQVREAQTFCEDPNLTVVWAGDFNQNLLGPLCGGSSARRTELLDRLAKLGFEAWNRLAPHATPELFTIDLICGHAGLAVHRSETIPNAHEGRLLSDHSGYVVELRFP